jgi:hypothetical protein
LLAALLNMPLSLSLALFLFSGAEERRVSDLRPCLLAP